jgi:hypothetical protein
MQMFFANGGFRPVYFETRSSAMCRKPPLASVCFGKLKAIKPQNFNGAMLCRQGQITASIQYPLIGTKAESEYRTF